MKIGLLFAAFALGVGRLCAAEPGPDFSKLTPVAPCAELVKAAQERQIPLQDFDPAGEEGKLSTGDSFTGLATLFEKGARQTQWLLYLEALPASPSELARRNCRDMVLYSGRSNRFEYVSSPAVVRLRTIGPFANTRGHGASVQDHNVCFALDRGFLGLGLERAADKIYDREQRKAKGTFWFGAKPPTPEQIAEGRELAEALHLTMDDERALGGMIPALFSYFGVVQHTEGLEEILWKVVDKPSLWSVVRHVGVSADLIIDSAHFSPVQAKEWAAADNSFAYHFPILLELNNKLALTVTLLVTNPRPPLLSCGGVVGMLAEKPGDKETYLTLRIISARCKTGSE